MEGTRLSFAVNLAFAYASLRRRGINSQLLRNIPASTRYGLKACVGIVKASFQSIVKLDLINLIITGCNLT